MTRQPRVFFSSRQLQQAEIAVRLFEREVLQEPALRVVSVDGEWLPVTL